MQGAYRGVLWRGLMEVYCGGAYGEVFWVYTFRIKEQFYSKCNSKLTQNEHKSSLIITRN